MFINCTTVYADFICYFSDSKSLPFECGNSISFIRGEADQILNLFEKVILICDQQDLLGKELFAIDGCKMSSNVCCRTSIW